MKGQYYVQRVCSPTRSAIMAGRYPYHMGLARKIIADGHPLGMPLNQTTIANELKKGGYATHCVGKWDLGMHKWEYTPTYRGFDSFYGYYSAAEDYFNHSLVRKHSALDFRNNTKPVRDKKGVYSRIDMSLMLKKHPTLIVATYLNGLQ